MFLKEIKKQIKFEDPIGDRNKQLETIKRQIRSVTNEMWLNDRKIDKLQTTHKEIISDAALGVRWTFVLKHLDNYTIFEFKQNGVAGGHLPLDEDELTVYTTHLAVSVSSPNHDILVKQIKTIVDRENFLLKKFDVLMKEWGEYENVESILTKV